MMHAVVGFCKRKSTQIGAAVAVLAVAAFGAGVAYQKGKESTGNMPLDDDQLNRINNGNVLRFNNPYAGPNARLLVYKNNPPAGYASADVEDEDEDDYEDGYDS